MPLGAGPERDHGLQRRTPGEPAGDFGHQDRIVVGECEALARPGPHAHERCAVFGTLLDEASRGDTRRHAPAGGEPLLQRVGVVVHEEFSVIASEAKQSRFTCSCMRRGDCFVGDASRACPTCTYLMPISGKPEVGGLLAMTDIYITLDPPPTRPRLRPHVATRIFRELLRWRKKYWRRCERVRAGRRSASTRCRTSPRTPR